MRLMMKKRRRNSLIFRGEILTYMGEHWVLTGYDSDRRVVWIGRDRKIKELEASDLGLHWEDLDIAA